MRDRIVAAHELELVFEEAMSHASPFPPFRMLPNPQLMQAQQDAQIRWMADETRRVFSPLGKALEHRSLESDKPKGHARKGRVWNRDAEQREASYAERHALDYVVQIEIVRCALCLEAFENVGYRKVVLPAIFIRRLGRLRAWLRCRHGSRNRETQKSKPARTPTVGRDGRATLPPGRLAGSA
jgi:hypothetical protein